MKWFGRKNTVTVPDTPDPRVSTGEIVESLRSLTDQILATGREVRYCQELADQDLNPKSRSDGYQTTFLPDKVLPVDPDSSFNLISSKAGKHHLPAIDLDMPVRVVESSTPGHYHLYIERKLPWRNYVALLKGFYDAGLIEPGWYKSAIAHKESHLRPPHVKKPDYYDRLLNSLKEGSHDRSNR